MCAVSAITKRKNILIETSRAHTKSRRGNFILKLEKLLKLDMSCQRFSSLICKKKEKALKGVVEDVKQLSIRKENFIYKVILSAK